jgi:tetratricopeptide (TPR) repeat protein
VSEPVSGITSAGALARAEHLRALGRWDEAEQAARTGLAEHPEDPALLRSLSIVLLGAGGDRHAEGLAAADAAAALEPEREHPHRLRALHLSMMGRHTEAVAAGYRAVQIAPNDPFAATGYARVLQRAGRLPDAHQVARRVVELAPHDAASHFLLADVSSDMGDRRTARAAYLETLRLDPAHAGARHDLAVLDSRTHHPGRALRGLIDAGRMDPTATGVLPNVGAVLWQLSWRLRILLLLAVFVVLGAGGADRSGGLSTATARFAAAGVLVVGAALAWWTTRGLRSGTWPVMRAALAADGPLAGTWIALGLCVALYATVVITGVAVLVAGVWFVLLGLAVLAVAVGVGRRRRN